MNLWLFDRRTLLRSSAFAAGSLAFAGLRLEPAAAARGTSGTASVAGALMGWLIIRPDGGGLIRLIELDASSMPKREIAAETILPMSLARAARCANEAALRTVAASWDLSPADCVCRMGRIEHSASDRSIPFALWTDFA